jgi:hypothetical protein
MTWRKIRHWRILWSVLLLMISGSVAVVAQAAGELTGTALVEALRGGGYSLYFRHVATDWSQQDRVTRAGDWVDCDPTRMRQLSDSGRDAARAIGAAIRRLGIPVGEVLASPYCRTVETAELMDIGAVRTSTDVINMRVAAYFGGRQAIIASARRLLSTPPAAGSNRVIVAHGNVARDSTPVYPGEGEGVVFEPLGDGGFGVVGRISPQDWQRLVQ